MTLAFQFRNVQGFNFFYAKIDTAERIKIEIIILRPPIYCRVIFPCVIIESKKQHLSCDISGNKM
ncbi:hypothetical protein CRX72_00005 [Pantoea sp. BRM17]|nr:hypothetical protein CRX72_00005 [Pantoea sp. BRM17]